MSADCRENFRIGGHAEEEVANLAMRSKDNSMTTALLGQRYDDAWLGRNPRTRPEIAMTCSQRKKFWLVSALTCMTTFAPGMALAGDLTPIGSRAAGFTLPSQEATPVSLSDYKGKWVVLYFYPKDQTSGCTLEAHNFQRDLQKYDALNAVVLGVSLDTVESHKSFCTKDSLTFKLLADPDHKVVDAYGVPIRAYGTMHFAERTTFLISPDGTVVKEWTVKDIAAHSAEVLAAIQSQAGHTGGR
jgi:peroxiredoxin Q/BCP